MLEAPLRAQTATQQKQVERDWKAGDKALREERYGSAIAHFDRVLAVLERPDVPVEPETLSAALHNRADAYYSLEQYRLALRDYNRVIDLSPRDADAYAARSIARKTTGDYTGLIEDAKKAASLDSEYQVLLDAARSTVLYRRVLLGFLGLGALVLLMGAIPLLKSLRQLLKAG